MKRLFRNIPAWALAAGLTAALGVILQTQNVLARLGRIGADVGLGERLSMTGYDLLYLGSLYVVFVAMAFIVAFLAAGWVYRRAGHTRRLIYAVAGGVAILVMLFAMKMVFFDIHMIAGARSGFGIAMQVVAGAVGGWVFAALTRGRAEAV